MFVAMEITNIIFDEQNFLDIQAENKLTACPESQTKGLKTRFTF
jgi:hypothetical protein